MRLGILRSWRATQSLLFCPPLNPGPILAPTTVLAKLMRPVWREKREGSWEGEREREREGSWEREREKRREREGSWEREKCKI